MFLGHYGVAFAAKRASPRTSLGMLVLAGEWLDHVWPVLVLLGVEHVRIVPGLMAANPLEFYDYPWSHGLVTALGWSLLVGGVYFLVRRYGRGGLVVGAVVLSHWVLDLVVHRPDLPLWPDGPKLGLGLWSSVPATVLVEAAVFTLGITVYVRTTRPLDRIGRWGLVTIVALLILIYLASSFGPPPQSVAQLAWSSLLLLVFVPLAWWVDRHRMPRRAPEAIGTAPSPHVPAGAS